jgi:hypothetical protein
MPRFGADTIILTLGTMFVGAAPASAAASVTVSCDRVLTPEPKTVGMRDYIFSPDDALYLQKLRDQAGDQTIGRAKLPLRSVPLAE